nr:HAD family phosphatase [Actinomycetales bacterium]
MEPVDGAASVRRARPVPSDLPELLRRRLDRPGASLLFDLDGTLIDSEPTSVAAFRACFAARGWDIPEPYIVEHFIGRRATEVFRELDGPWTGLDPAALAAESLTYLDFEAIPPLALPGATAALSAWKGRVPIAIVTSAPRWWAEQSLGIVGGAAPDLVVAADSYERGKPHPDPFTTAGRLLDVDPARALAFDDAEPGVASARSAGVGLVVGVTTHLDGPVLEAAGAHATAPDMGVLSARV